MFRTVDNLTQMVGLRVKYLLAVLKETMQCQGGPGQQVQLSETTKRLICDLVQAANGSEIFELLVVFDSVQFVNYWAQEWATLLSQSSSLDQLKATIKSLQSVCTVKEIPENLRNHRSTSGVNLESLKTVGAASDVPVSGDAADSSKAAEAEAGKGRPFLVWRGEAKGHNTHNTLSFTVT